MLCAFLLVASRQVNWLPCKVLLFVEEDAVKDKSDWSSGKQNCQQPWCQVSGFFTFLYGYWRAFTQLFQWLAIDSNSLINFGFHICLRNDYAHRNCMAYDQGQSRRGVTIFWSLVAQRNLSAICSSNANGKWCILRHVCKPHYRCPWAFMYQFDVQVRNLALSLFCSY